LNGFTDKVAFIWSVADLLRGPYKPHQYGRVILPLTVLRRLDCVLEPTKQKVLERHAALRNGPVKDFEPILNRVAGQAFHNISKLDFHKLKGDPDKIAQNLAQYIKSFSAKARQIFEFFEFDQEIAKLDESDRLYQVIKKFAEIDLHPDVVLNHEMGLIFEDLIRRFNEASNETAGDHFTPREVIRLMVNLLFEPDGAVLRKAGIVRTLFDPACGTGGMLSVSEEYLRDLNPQARLEVFGQDYNNEAFAICCSDMMIKGQNPENIKFGDSFTKDGLPGMKFDYMLANPPFGVEWKPQADTIEKEHETKGFEGRFGAGLPRINDGSFLFLQHMISKMKPSGTRLGIVFNGSPLFTGDAGSGESNIRKWVIEQDWLEAIVALPDQMFYNTGISTYIWLVTNRKRRERAGKIQLINAADLYQKMRRSLGNKRNELSDAHIAEITRIYGEFKETEQSKIFDNEDLKSRLSRRLTNATPSASISARALTSCLRLRANRSSFHTRTASNFLRWASTISLLSAGRDSFASETPRSTYSFATAHPRRDAYSRSSDSCISGFCPLRVDTRAYRAARVIGRVSCVEGDGLKE